MTGSDYPVQSPVPLARTQTASPNHPVAVRRITGKHTPCDKGLTDVVGEVSSCRDAFRTWWTLYNARPLNTAIQKFFHPRVREIELTGEANGTRAIRGSRSSPRRWIRNPIPGNGFGSLQAGSRARSVRRNLLVVLTVTTATSGASYAPAVLIRDRRSS